MEMVSFSSDDANMHHWMYILLRQLDQNLRKDRISHSLTEDDNYATLT